MLQCDNDSETKLEFKLPILNQNKVESCAENA